MSSKFIAMDKYPLDISRAYVHKTFVGGVFSIIYASIWIALTVSIIVKYFQSPDVLNSHLISGIDQQYSRPNYSLVTVKSKLILQDHNATDYVVPGATHTDLYDQMDKIPFDRLVAFFNKYLGE